ncbi:hypothetical protein CK203_098925 [Vitis vinifera]|uniref:Retrotransposon gag domain-containing protein n=1 Tax=Vitis vinifera TaxID=29760 RepID=A0A438CJW3_VITVI|nr:hypothetical protein CK203_098925 [Vitis vinifera]
MKRLKHTGSIREYVKEFSTRLCLRYLTCLRRSYLTSWTTCKVGRARVEETWCPRPSHTMAVESPCYASKEGSSKGPSGKDGKGKDKRKEFTPRPIASYVMVHTGRAILRGKPKCYDRGKERRDAQRMRQEGWSSKHPRRRMAQGSQFSCQAITWSSSRGDYAHRLMGRKGRLHSGTHGLLQDGIGMDFLQKVKACHYLSYAQWHPRGGEAMHGPYGHQVRSRPLCYQLCKLRRG